MIKAGAWRSNSNSQYGSDGLGVREMMPRRDRQYPGERDVSTVTVGPMLTGEFILRVTRSPLR